MIIEENKSLQHYNTFGIKVIARYYTEISSIEDFREILADKKFSGEKKLILGGGSNILFTRNFDGLVIRNCIKGVSFSNEGGKMVKLCAAAGEVWHQVVLQCIERNYAGIENLSLIPGCVGAAPMQNIGAYGVEIKDVFEQLEAVDMQSGELVTLTLSDCNFGYRESVFKHTFKDKFLITSVTLQLTNMNLPGALYRFKTDYGDIKATLSDMRVYDLNIKAVSDAVIKIRSAKLPDPGQLGNAGSFFKNPVVSKEKFEDLVYNHPLMPSFLQKDGTVKIPAGWLIEQCGWKGKQIGHTGAHKTQALVLVNYGDATGQEVYQLAKNIQASVMEKFGIEILPEVNLA
jgi:UDP-N-acetylmuramate dehydrogenase